MPPSTEISSISDVHFTNDLADGSRYLRNVEVLLCIDYAPLSRGFHSKTKTTGILRTTAYGRLLLAVKITRNYQNYVESDYSLSCSQLLDACSYSDQT
jgi:hypothetical protein